MLALWPCLLLNRQLMLGSLHLRTCPPPAGPETWLSQLALGSTHALWLQARRASARGTVSAWPGIGPNCMSTDRFGLPRCADCLSHKWHLWHLTAHIPVSIKCPCNCLRAAPSNMAARSGVQPQCLTGHQASCSSQLTPRHAVHAIILHNPWAMAMQSSSFASKHAITAACMQKHTSLAEKSAASLATRAPHFATGTFYL